MVIFVTSMFGNDLKNSDIFSPKTIFPLYTCLIYRWFHCHYPSILISLFHFTSSSAFIVTHIPFIIFVIYWFKKICPINTNNKTSLKFNDTHNFWALWKLMKVETFAGIRQPTFSPTFSNCYNIKSTLINILVPAHLCSQSTI